MAFMVTKSVWKSIRNAQTLLGPKLSKCVSKKGQMWPKSDLEKKEILKTEAKKVPFMALAVSKS